MSMIYDHNDLALTSIYPHRISVNKSEMGFQILTDGFETFDSKKRAEFYADKRPTKFTDGDVYYFPLQPELKYDSPLGDSYLDVIPEYAIRNILRNHKMFKSNEKKRFISKASFIGVITGKNGANPNLLQLGVLIKQD
jgi:hypothetical protein